MISYRLKWCYTELWEYDQWGSVNASCLWGALWGDPTVNNEADEAVDSHGPVCVSQSVRLNARPALLLPPPLCCVPVNVLVRCFLAVIGSYIGA